MKILQLTAENVKKLKVIDIKPASDFVQITGKNGSGKTSVLDAIWWALGGKDGIQDKPIRDGAEKARIRLNLGDLVVERRFTQSGTTLTVENAEGARYQSPQSMLDGLVGELSFDPLAFAQMDPRKQYDELKRVAKIEIDLDEMERLNKADYDRRTEKNREVKDLTARANGFAFEYPEAEGPIDVSALLGHMQDAAQHNADLERRKDWRAETVRQIEAGKREIAALEAQLDQKRSAVAELEALAANAEALPEPVNADALRTQIEEAQRKNAEFTRRQEQKKLREQADAAKDASDALTKAMEEREAEKALALQTAKMPVSGLSLAEGRVLLNGVPFDQASSAEQIRTSVAIAMAANPKLRIIRIKDGSLLDDDGLRLIAEQAKESDYQVWIERVDSSGKVGIVMEDGQVVLDNDAPVAA